MAKEMIAMLLAGGQGSRLYTLTQKLAKPAVPFGGKYRIIDFPLSNCVNSGIDTVGILTQYQPLVLNEYIGNGQPWDLDRLYGGVHVLPPYQQASGSDWYKGTANAIYQNINFIERYDPKYVIILSGDQICKQDYSDFLEFHKSKGAEFSVAVMEVPWEEAGRFGLMVTDENDKITEFQEKPKEPSQILLQWVFIYSTGISSNSTLSKTKMIPTPRTTSVRILFPICFRITGKCTHTVSTATGRTSAPFPHSGRQTWKCSIPKTAASTSLTRTGAYTAGTAV